MSLDRRLRRAAGCNQVVDNQDSFALGYSIGMNLDRVGAVFEFVILSNRLDAAACPSCEPE